MRRGLRMICGAIVLIVVMVCMVSCGGNESPGPESYFTAEGEVYGIASNKFTYGVTPFENEQGELLYTHTLSFLSKGLTFTPGLVVGTGDMISIGIHGYTSGELDEGEYEYIEASINTTPISMRSGFLNLNVNANGPNTGGDYYAFTSGEMTVTKSGSIYTIEATGEAARPSSPTDTKIFTLKFVGELTRQAD